MDLVLRTKLNEDIAYKIMREIHEINMSRVFRSIRKLIWIWTKFGGYSFLCL